MGIVRRWLTERNNREYFVPMVCCLRGDAVTGGGDEGSDIVEGPKNR